MRTGKRPIYLTPPDAQQAIIAFDAGKKVKPFTFDLASPVMVRKVQRIRLGTDASALAAARAYRKRQEELAKRPKSAIKHRKVHQREREYGVCALTA